MRIIIADRHALMRDGMGRLLTSLGNFEIAAEVADGAALAECLRKCPADLLIVRPYLFAVSGPELVRQVRVAAPTLSILALIEPNEPKRGMELLRLGVEGVLTMNATADELMQGIQAVSAGIRFAPKYSALWRRPSKRGHE